MWINTRMIKFHPELLKLYIFPYVFVMAAQNRLELCENARAYRQKQLTDEEVTVYAMMMFVQQVGVRAGIGDVFKSVDPHVSPSHLDGRRV